MEIARTLRIRGRSKMDPDELRKAIYDVLKNEPNLIEILKNLPSNALELLDIIKDNKGKIKRETLQEKFGKSYPTFRKYFNMVYSYGLIYSIDNYWIITPSEILKTLESFVQEEEETMRLDDFLKMYLLKEHLREICARFDLPISGKKEELIDRIMKANKPPEEILGTLSLSSLKEIAEQMGLIKSGKKDEVIARILEHISVAKIKEYYVTEERKVSEEKEKKPRSKIDEIWTDIYSEIEQNFKMIISKKDKERDLERQLYQYLYSKYGDKIKYELRTKAGRIDLAFDDVIGIELKYKPRKPTLQRLIQQVDEYREDFKRIIVVLAVDPANMRTVNAYKDKLEARGDTKVVIKYV